MRTEKQPTPSDLHREARRLEQVRHLRPAQPAQLDLARVRAGHRSSWSGAPDDPDPQEAA